MEEIFDKTLDDSFPKFKKIIPVQISGAQKNQSRTNTNKNQVHYKQNAENQR